MFTILRLLHYIIDAQPGGPLCSGVGRILVWGRIEAPRGRGAEGADGGGVQEGSGEGAVPLPRKFLII